MKYLNACDFIDRCTSIAITQGVGYCAGMITMKIFPILETKIGLDGTLYLYAALSVIMLFWGVITIENTEDLSLVDVERLHDTRFKKATAS